MIPLHESTGGVRFAIKVVPGASRDRIVGELGDAMKIAVSKPAQDGAANKAVVKLMASALAVSEANVIIIRGHSNPRKEIAIIGIALEEVRRRLADLVNKI